MRVKARPPRADSSWFYQRVAEQNRFRRRVTIVGALLLVGYLAFTAAVVYVAIHFITKYW